MFDKVKVVLKSLNSHEVKYLVIGGMAAIAHGAERNTFDVDFLIEKSEENARRLLNALLDIGFGTAALIEPARLIKNEITVFRDLIKIDVMTKSPGIDFEEVWPRRVVMEAHGVKFNVLSWNDLLASKRAAGRTKDQQDIDFLESGEA